MAQHTTRRVITPVEDFSSSRTSPATRVRSRLNPSSQPPPSYRSNLPSNKPLQVSFASPSTRRPVQRAGIAEKGAIKSSPAGNRSGLSARTSPSVGYRSDLSVRASLSAGKRSDLSARTSPVGNQSDLSARTSPFGNRRDLSARTSPFAHDHRTVPPAQNIVDAQKINQNVLSSHEHGLVNASVSNVEDPSLQGLHAEQEATNVGAEKEDQTEFSERLHTSAKEVSDDFNIKRDSGNTESYYHGQTDSDNDENVGVEFGADRVGRSREKKPKHNEQEWRTMATFAKAQGIDLMRQVQQEQKRRQLEQGQEPVDIAKAEMEEMRRILQERRRSSDEYFAPTETERESSPERHSPRRRDVSVDQYSRKDSADSEIHDQVNAIKNKNPSKVLDWLRATDDDSNDRIAVSEDRTLSLLQAIKQGTVNTLMDTAPSLQEDWVPMERLREAERRSSVAEEQIRQFEELLNAAEGAYGDEQLRAVLSRSKTMARHFHHLKKFVDDRHSELKKLHSLHDKDVLKTWRPHGGVSPEKIRKDFQEHENHKKRLMQVYSVYNDLMKFLRFEHSRRVDAESKTQQLASQIKRQTAALKKAEKVIKHTAMTPRMADDLSFFKGVSNLEARNPSPTPSGMHSPRMADYSVQASPFTLIGSPEAEEGDHLAHLDNARFNHGMPTLRRIDTTGKSNLRAAALPSSANIAPSLYQTLTKQLTHDLALEQGLSRNSSPEPGAILSNSDLIAQNHKKEFEEIERALIEEGRSKGFADVDLYSEKKTVGREETSWEYRHVHLDFVRPDQARSPPTDQGWETLNLHSLGNVPISKRTASPSRSEGAIFEEKHGCPMTLKAVRSTSVKEVESQAMRKPYRRILSSPARINESAHMEIAPFPHGAVSDSTFHATVDSLEDESWEDVAQDALDEMWVDVGKEELWSDAARQDDMSREEGGGNKADGISDDVTESKETMKDDMALENRAEFAVGEQRTGVGHPSSRDADVRIGDFRASERLPSDLRRRVAAVEIGHLAHRLQEQVKRRRWLLLVQVCLFMVALLWSTTWRGHMPPPT